jgi:hypothetical protein
MSELAMSVDQVIALCASLGACLSAVATFLTVRKIAAQRRSSYRPDVVVSRTRIHGSPPALVDGPFPSHWVKGDNKNDTDQMVLGLHLDLRNVGLGTAKDVVIHWSFPFEQILELVNGLAQRNLTPVHFALENDAVVINLSGRKEMSIWRNQKVHLVDYLLPASIEKQVTTIPVPLAYQSAVSALIYLVFNEKKEDGAQRDMPKVPALQANISYADIGGGEHKASIDVLFEVSSIQMTSGACVFNATLRAEKAKLSAESAVS